MHKIEKTSYGVRLTFGGYIEKAEMEKWLAESQQALRSMSQPFGNLIDMRTLKPLPADATAVMEKGQALYKQAGMQRSSVILESQIVAMQFKRIAKSSGIYDFERYLAADATPDWEKKALDWITNGIDPDLEEDQ
jgi:hypothetical protein